MERRIERDPKYAIGHQITCELSTNSGDNFVDIGPVICGNPRFLANDEAWKRQISQIFSFKIKTLKIARQSGRNAGFLNVSVHKSLLLIALSERHHALIGGRNPLFYQSRLDCSQHYCLPKIRAMQQNRE